MKALGAFLLMLVAATATIGLLVVCSRVAGGPDAWKVAVVLVGTVPWLVAFLTRERR